LQACLRSLERCGPSHISYETIVVLNEAGPAAAADLRESVSGVEVVASLVNLGLAGAGNRGRAMARGELLVLLHDDAEIEPGWLEALVETADAHPEAGAVGGKVLFPDGRLQNAGMILWRNGCTSEPWVGEAPEPATFDRLRAVDYCGTSSLLVRAAVWDAVGGLDERFYPVYYVDVDLAMAIRRLGLAVLYQPGSRIRHHQGASGVLRFRRFVTERNRMLFLEKWGAALEEHEPPEPDSTLAVARAVARAEACHVREAAIGPPSPREEFDPVSHEQRHMEKSRALQKAWLKHLTGALEDVEGDRLRWREHAASLEREVAGLLEENQRREQMRREAEGYAKSLLEDNRRQEQMRCEAEGYANSLLEDNRIREQMRWEAERFAKSLLEDNRLREQMRSEAERYALSLEAELAKIRNAQGPETKDR
jgi:GT2 family glycosyltransferase